MRFTIFLSVPTIRPVRPLNSFCFSTSGVAHDTWYCVQNQRLSLEQVRRKNPFDRTVQEWSTLVDWERQRSRPYVVVDPFDPQGLLYLSEREYLVQSKVWLSTDTPAIIVARPGAVAPVLLPSEPSQNTPPRGRGAWFGPDFSQGQYDSWNRTDRQTLRQFVDLRSWILRNTPVRSGMMVSVSPKTVARVVMLWTQELLHRLGSKSPGARLGYVVPFVQHLRILLANNGPAFTISRLKISLFCLYSLLAGNPLKSTSALGQRVRLRGGLPVFLSRPVRRTIMAGNLEMIRLWASLFNIYRCLWSKGQGSLESIKTPRFDSTESTYFSKFQLFCTEAFPKLLADKIGHKPDFQYKTAFGLLILSAGANSSIAMRSLVLDAQAWAAQPTNWVAKWFELWGDDRALWSLKTHECTPHENIGATSTQRGQAGLANLILGASRLPAPIGSFFKNQGTEIRPILGRLHAIDEPAGKVRIVAICDYWTQLALSPIHEFLFSILRMIKGNDATFDQEGTVKDYADRGLRPHFSFDLKSATDLIPCQLYELVLTPWLSKEGAELWSRILTDRDFIPPVDSVDFERGDFVRYTRGQPMGALSSWAGLAIVHHALVQFAAYTVGWTSWFDRYVVLGDDVDIADREVAMAYQRVCSDFGITIGIAKSLQSDENSFEFANQRFFQGKNVSPLSLKEELSARNWVARLELVRKAALRLLDLRPSPNLVGGLPVHVVRRVALSAPQWNMLSLELQGRVTKWLPLVDFVLLNPFTALSTGRDINIAQVLKWLGNLFPTENVWAISQGGSPTLRFSRIVLRSALEQLERVRLRLNEPLVNVRVGTKLSEIGGVLHQVPRVNGKREAPYIPFVNPTPAGVKLAKSKRYAAWVSEGLPLEIAEIRATLETWLESRTARPSGLRRALKTLWSHITPQLPGPVMGLPDTMAYLAYCIAKYNAPIASQLKEINKEARELKGLILFCTPETVDDALFSRVLRFWLEVFSLPPTLSAHTGKSEGGDGAILGLVNRKVTQVEKAVLEATRGRNRPDVVTIPFLPKEREEMAAPVLELLRFMASEFGVLPPMLHLLNRHIGKTLGVSLLADAKKVHDARIRRDASPVMQPVGTNYGNVIPLDTFG